MIFIGKDTCYAKLPQTTGCMGRMVAILLHQNDVPSDGEAAPMATDAWAELNGGSRDGYPSEERSQHCDKVASILRAKRMYLGTVIRVCRLV